MAYPEKSSQRSSVSSVSSHVRLSQSSSKSYSLLGAREQRISTQQENPSRQKAASVLKALSLLTGRAAALGGLARVSSSAPKPNSGMGMGWSGALENSGRDSQKVGRG